MIHRANFGFRVLADLFVGVSAVVAFVFASHRTNGAWLIAIFVVLLLAAGMSGYLEPSAKRVWVHAFIIMSPELIALPCVLLTCRGFECAGIAAFLGVASLFTFVLVALSFAAFFIRRRISRSSAA
jgi:hypothetical protein